MSISLKPVARKSPKDGTVKYYLTVESKGSVELKDLAEDIAGTCTLTAADVIAALDALELAIASELKFNRSVRLGDLGSYHIRANSKGADTAEECTIPDCLKKYRIHYNKSSKLRHTFRIGAEGIHFVIV